MAAIETTHAHKHGATTNVFHRLIVALSDWNERRITRRALSQLSDRELNDIGVSRADIEYIARRR